MARASEPADRRARLLEEALALVAVGGLAAVTHRAVERAAGAPHGSVTYYFGSRDGLVDAMVDHLVERCEERVSGIAREIAMALAPRGATLDVAPFVAAITAWMDADRDLQLARLELELEAIREPRIRARMTDAGRVFWRMCEPLALALGSPDPERDGRALAAMVDGLLVDRLAHDPASDDVIGSALTHLLRSWATES
ncbi:MAG: TetR family transcriptional regulator [Solirubrobacteraceae bacterium]|nr:TetR family transcriptional regulator [Solirubrobacteraceae bacterium]